MSNAIPPIPRSPEMMSADDTALLVVDMQDKLLDLIPGGKKIIWNVRRLIDGAKVYNLPIHVTEQYPQGLGPTNPELAQRLPAPLTKLSFSCCTLAELVGRLEERNIHKILAAGIEAHVCVMQTVLDLLAHGFRVYVPVDAVGARFDVDRETALRRMEACGASLVTTEMTLFEWCRESGTPQFKQISALIREPAP